MANSDEKLAMFYAPLNFPRNTSGQCFPEDGHTFPMTEYTVPPCHTSLGMARHIVRLRVATHVSRLATIIGYRQAYGR
ncbi:protein of unknown function [Denitratisoma oestradiolicum]|uniref:Uncharacterized protein n=1 Tax=Denitratisoma oestradiolicum TaxID=311182 RepID=A0A6S6XP01_9PROT|nr:protein of unknown function [Denitratisoma oestradiolicum]